MKLILVVFSVLILSFGASATEEVKTEAKWFSPDCKDCPKLLTPGRASLGNSIGVYRPGSNTKKKPKATGAVNSGK
jgi:hypothetical protein